MRLPSSGDGSSIDAGTDGDTRLSTPRSGNLFCTCAAAPIQSRGDHERGHGTHRRTVETKGTLMTQATATNVYEPSTRGERKGPMRFETHEIRYLDLSGDGVPDAVEHIDRRPFRRTGSDVFDAVEEHRRLSYGIGIDGIPAGVTERMTVYIRDDAGRLRKSRAL